MILDKEEGKTVKKIRSRRAECRIDRRNEGRGRRRKNSELRGKRDVCVSEIGRVRRKKLHPEVEFLPVGLVFLM